VKSKSTPFFLERDMLGRDHYGGNILPTPHWNTTRTCTFPDGGEPTTETVRVEPGTFKWSLKPRR
jgi:hypothetical protein